MSAAPAEAPETPRRLHQATANVRPRPLTSVPLTALSAAARAEIEDVAQELDWRERALCAQTDPEAFFPEKGGSTREAKRTCLACDVRVECLEYALANDERFGIWGGMSERERRRAQARAL